GDGVRVRLDADHLDRWPNVRGWFFKEKPKREQDSEALHREIREAGFALLAAAPARIHPDALRHKGKGQVIRCPRCGEWYPAELGPTCRPCQGAGPYEDWAALHGVK
uniref:FmdE family protein n=1 Tax=uncultured Desulfovibrio sp. TaxID=167968 RepID=UPI003208B65C